MSYNTVDEANTYLSMDMNADEWQACDQKSQALEQAYRAINRLNFKGEKTEDDQSGEFPRNGDTTVPQAILDAECELALRFAQGVDPELEDEARRIKQSAFANVKTTYKDADSELPHVIAGIPSAKAWRLLLPYLSDVNGFSTYRV